MIVSMRWSYIFNLDRYFAPQGSGLLFLIWTDILLPREVACRKNQASLNGEVEVQVELTDNFETKSL